MLVLYWVITTLDHDIEITGGIESKQWEDSIVRSGKVVRVLDLIKYINNRTSHIESGEVIIYVDNKRVAEYYKQIRKESEVSIEAARIIT